MDDAKSVVDQIFSEMLAGASIRFDRPIEQLPDLIQDDGLIKRSLQRTAAESQIRELGVSPIVYWESTLLPAAEPLLTEYSENKRTWILLSDGTRRSVIESLDFGAIVRQNRKAYAAFCALMHATYIRVLQLQNKPNLQSEILRNAVSFGGYIADFLRADLVEAHIKGEQRPRTDRANASKPRGPLKHKDVADLAVETYIKMRTGLKRTPACERTAKVLASKGHEVDPQTVKRFLEKYHPDLS